MNKTLLKLMLGMIIFSDEHKKLGNVVNVENNEVLLEGDENPTVIDPEFCHEATAEELEGNEWAANIIASRENEETGAEPAETADINAGEALVEDEEKL